MNSTREIEDLVKDINLNVEVFTKDQVSSVETELKFNSDMLGPVDEIDPYNLNNVLEPRSSCSGKNQYKQGLVTLQIKVNDKTLNFTGYSVVGLREDPIPRACYMLLVDLLYSNAFTRSFNLKLQKLWNNSYMRGYDFKIGDTYPLWSSDYTELVEIKSRYQFFRNKVDIQDFTRTWRKNLAIIICSFINNYILNPESISLSQVVYGVKTDRRIRIQGIILKSPINYINYIKDMRSDILKDLRKKLNHDQIDLILKELMIKVISVKDPEDSSIDSKLSVIVIIALPKIDGLGPCFVKGLFGERCYIRSKNTFQEINRDNSRYKILFGR